MDNLIIKNDIASDIAVVTVSGRIDSSTAPNLDAELKRVLRTQSKVVIDLMGVAYISSAGLRAIVKAYQSAKKAGGNVMLAGISDSVKSILLTVGMLDMFGVFPSVNEAIASF